MEFFKPALQLFLTPCSRVNSAATFMRCSRKACFAARSKISEFYNV